VGCTVLYWDALESTGTSKEKWDMLGFTGTFRDLPGQFGMQWDPLELVEERWDMLRLTGKQ